MIRRALSNRRVSELAAGTGFWTQRYADDATSVMATDINDSTLALARHRRAWPGSIQFASSNAFELQHIEGAFDAVFAAFLWSHIPVDQLDDLLAGIVQRVDPGAVIVFTDNNYVHGSNHPIARTDEHGNTFQQRRLSNGSEWEVLKNFPDTTTLTETLSRFGRSVEVHKLQYFWMAQFET